ncbi:MAG: bifunctional homocysteine S-methyltransferase/methylenetetrahydrofolate reductase [Deltaproteobacteria bacterium]|nr:bifunctional homocysteine S-methyltransferase/methylenetetrahydrofolate reductase [Deltaproteobacteria bacterium]
MTRTIKPFREALDAGLIVADGAIGTLLYERGVFINNALEEIALAKPGMLRQIHQDYLDAGAQILETHTFAANRVKLARYDLGDKFETINRRAAELALEVAGNKAWVAGSIGPSSVMPGVVADDELDEIKTLFREQAAILASAGVDVIMLETFRLLSEMKVAIEAVKSVCDLPIIAQLAFDAETRTADGADPGRAAELLKRWGATVAGANCVEGPDGVFRAVSQMLGHGIPVSALPNAGYPRLQDGRLIYMATPEYFGVYARRFFKAGVAIVGGCCGTNPDHIRRVANAARMLGGQSDIEVIEVPERGEPTAPSPRESGLAAVPFGERTRLASKIQRVWIERAKEQKKVPLSPDNFVVSVEVNPPPGLDPRSAIEAARMLREGKVDVINIADGPRATVRMSNQVLAHLVQRELGMETILHVCCRDRNLLGLQSDLLAAHVLGLHNLVIITGDPPKLGDYPNATAVFDLDSIGLLRLVEGLNRGIDPAGKSFGATTRFMAACGAEPAALDYARELKRLAQKKAAGAELIMTQPVYDPAVLGRFLDDVAHLELPVLVGLLPLASYRNAEFLHNEVPGMSIPEPIRERMRKAKKGAEARAEGIAIAQETLLEVAHRVVGAYIMPPLGRYASALDVLQVVGYPRPSPELMAASER